MHQSLETLLERIEQDSDNPHEKGKRFERIVLNALRHDPIYQSRFSSVVRYAKWAEEFGISRQDTGIDLVGYEQEGGYCAIQCKFYRRDISLGQRDIANFFASSERDFKSRILVYTGRELSSNLLKLLDRSRIPCQLLDYTALRNLDVDWPNLYPEDAKPRPRIRHQLRKDQREAIEAALKNYSQHDRGRLILPCGTGKTFTTLRIAEKMALRGGRALYLVPSISLVAQSMREWAVQGELPMRFTAVCSDTSVGRDKEDLPLKELELPATTDSDEILARLNQQEPDSLKVVFCTYHSLPRIAQAQDRGAPPFDLIICDEAHRTTGVEQKKEESSAFTLVHDNERIRGRKRLYTTATPRIYADSVKNKASHKDLIFYSMDKEEVYGPEFYQMSFGEAVEKNLLSDYKVSIFSYSINRNISIEALNDIYRDDPVSGRGVNINQMALLLGCWDALADPEGSLHDRSISGDMSNPCRRVITFATTIKNSKRFRDTWSEFIPRYRQWQIEQQHSTHEELLEAEVRHVDGRDNAFYRREQLNWLEEPREENSARILTNARCLTEGVDVPALDAILFIAPRRSQIDIVQAVGRVMRKAEGKTFGHIIIPVIIDEGEDTTKALDGSVYQTVWDVLKALRSHDSRLDVEINRLALGEKKSERIIFNQPEDPADEEEDSEKVFLKQMPLNFADIPPGIFYAKMVEKVGDRRYWPSWAGDVAVIHNKLAQRILEAVQRQEECHDFETFLNSIRQTINPSFNQKNAVDLLAQHIITAPIYGALYEDFDFSRNNPVARELDRMATRMTDFGLQEETSTLDQFYESVRREVAGLEDPAARQKLLEHLYENFIKHALPKEAKRLGVVYTPTPLVDFLLRSADWALQQYFGKRLADEGVHILDPFAGTGTFLTRLIQDEELLPDKALEQKYHNELHANEIMLLAYYIAWVNIAEARAKRGLLPEPCPGLVWTDTFQDAERELVREGVGGQFDQTRGVSAANTEQIQRQLETPITVIVGNPPYRAGQRSADDDNPNVKYELLEQRVRDTYAARTLVSTKRTLYDHYKFAIRWATDRLGKQGVITFVSNASFIDANAESGLRACIHDEFTAAYIIHLRGAALKGRAEGQNVFDIKQPVAMLILVKDSKYDGPCQINYTAMPDGLKRQEKFNILDKAGTIEEIRFDQILPNSNHEWLNQRDESFDDFLLIGNPKTKVSKSEVSVFNLFSAGIVTAKDAWLFNSDQSSLKHSAEGMAKYYENQRENLAKEKIDYKTAIEPNSKKIKWSDSLRSRLKRNLSSPFDSRRMQKALYRPFVANYVYYDPFYMHSTYQIPKLFPDRHNVGRSATNECSVLPTLSLSKHGTMNKAICVSGRGADEFTCYFLDTIPCYDIVSKSQCFPRYTYHPLTNADLFAEATQADSEIIDAGEERYERRDNITDFALREFQKHYGDASITKDDIFYYTYGLLHQPDYRGRFANNLRRELPRIPMAPDFWAFAEAGRRLAALHLDFEGKYGDVEEYPLETDEKGRGDEAWQLERKKLKWGGKRPDWDQSQIVFPNGGVVSGIPTAAQDYVVNGRTPLAWAMDRYHIRQDKESGIVNDPNAWWAERGGPQAILPYLARLVTIAVETSKLVASLPNWE